MSSRLRSPFPWYGSKIKAAALIEQLLGPINNFVIPFAGSLGELLGRSEPARVETANDLDGFVVNAWRGLTHSPEEMARLCDHPVHETTMHAAHELLLSRAEQLAEVLRSHPTAHDVELAAWWVWGRSCWLGGGWCQDTEARGAATKGGMRVRVQGREGTPNHGQGVARAHGRTHNKRPQLSGQGTRPHTGHGVARPLGQMPSLSGSYTGHPAHGQGVHASHQREQLLKLFAAIAARLRWVRITCGEWDRILTPACTTSHGMTGVFLDPPYRHDGRSTRLYREDEASLSERSRAWCIANQHDPLLRIVIAGKGDEHDELLEHGWIKHVWRERDGETLWASPLCTPPADPQGDLFARAA